MSLRATILYSVRKLTLCIKATSKRFRRYGQGICLKATLLETANKGSVFRQTASLVSQ